MYTEVTVMGGEIIHCFWPSNLEKSFQKCFFFFYHSRVKETLSQPRWLLPPCDYASIHTLQMSGWFHTPVDALATPSLLHVSASPITSHILVRSPSSEGLPSHLFTPAVASCGSLFAIAPFFYSPHSPGVLLLCRTTSHSISGGASRVNNTNLIPSENGQQGHGRCRNCLCVMCFFVCMHV